MCLSCRILLTIHVEFWGCTPFCFRPPIGLVYSLPDRADTLHLSCTSRQDVLAMSLQPCLTSGEHVPPRQPLYPAACSPRTLTCVPFLSFVTAVLCCNITPSRNPSCHRLQKLLPCNLHTVIAAIDWFTVSPNHCCLSTASQHRHESDALA